MFILQLLKFLYFCIRGRVICRIFMIFEKLDGGTLLHNIWGRGLLREHDVSEVVKNIADGLFFLHQKGIMQLLARYFSCILA